MSGTKFISLLCLIFGFMVLFTGETKATHIVGGELRYACLGNNMYEITLTVRRDCENGADVKSLLKGPVCHGGFERLN